MARGADTGTTGSAACCRLETLPIVGRSRAILDVIAIIGRLARVSAAVLIEGETGTGKELAARALHYLGCRSGGPFVPVNCAALPDGLIESELFGHARGAFTDAREARAGLVAAAEAGTLFLDEVECLSPHAQAVLLRFLQDGTYRPVGSRDERRSDVRVVGASNLDRGDLIGSGGFRRDLFYRIAALSFRMPALRERPEDVPILAEHFLARYAREYGLEGAAFHAATLTALRSHSWPGNVRELENVVRRAVVLADGPLVRITVDLPEPAPRRASATADVGPDRGDGKRETRGAALADPAANGARGTAIPVPFELSFREAKSMVVHAFERAYIENALRAARGNLSRAARECGKERSRLGRLLKKHKVRRTDFQS